MARRIEFYGRFRRVNEAQLRRRANDLDDPRYVFYKAMIENNTYEEYAAEVGNKEFLVETWHPPERMNGHREMVYAAGKRRRWIVYES